MQPFMVKVAMGLSGLFTGIGLSVFGYMPNQKQTETALVGIRVLMFVLPIVLLMISLFVYLKFYRLNGKFAEDVRGELAGRRVQHE
jgi:melibiose permease